MLLIRSISLNAPERTIYILVRWFYSSPEEPLDSAQSAAADRRIRRHSADHLPRADATGPPPAGRPSAGQPSAEPKLFGSGKPRNRSEPKNIVQEGGLSQGGKSAFSLLSSRLYTLRPPVSFALSAKRRLHRNKPVTVDSRLRCDMFYNERIKKLLIT